MLKTRVVPILLLGEAGLVKGRCFKDHVYVGDPINAVKIFNEKEVDELVFLDITATKEAREPNFELIEQISSEAFMPFAYGGGVTTLEQATKLFQLGVEKIVLNTSAYTQPNLIEEVVAAAGSQSVVVSMDVKKNLFGKYEIYIENGTKKIDISPDEYALQLQDRGVGELIVTSIKHEGKGQGYDMQILSHLAEKLEIPVVASGGAGSLTHFQEAVSTSGVSAVAAGSLFVFYGKHRAVLITYPSYSELETIFQEK